VPEIKQCDLLAQQQRGADIVGGDGRTHGKAWVPDPGFLALP
jgi:hypothetical protein